MKSAEDAALRLSLQNLYELPPHLYKIFITYPLLLVHQMR